ncbi:hypothetical protein BURMUCGD1_6464 [Burkholderia multivorans CGD1]|nr:hypothetical protein BURMUCGD1_6464 [Burkholderia multivorans CGD1]
MYAAGHAITWTHNSRTLHDILRTFVLFGSDATRNKKDACATK